MSQKTKNDFITFALAMFVAGTVILADYIGLIQLTLINH